jgi:hypothetical protein
VNGLPEARTRANFVYANGRLLLFSGKEGGRREEVEGGGRRWKEVEGGGRRWKEVEGGGRRWKEVEGGGRRWKEGQR